MAEVDIARRAVDEFISRHRTTQVSREAAELSELLKVAPRAGESSLGHVRASPEIRGRPIIREIQLSVFTTLENKKAKG
jgi:hypothetical protein